MQNYFLLSTLTTKNFTLPPLRTTSLKRFMNNQKKKTSVRVQDNISISTRKRWTFVTVLSSWEVLNWTNERTIWKIISDDHRKKTCNKSPASFFVVAASAPHSVRFGWLSFILFQKSESSQQTNYFQINIDTHVLCVMLRWKWNTKKKERKNAPLTTNCVNIVCNSMTCPCFTALSFTFWCCKIVSHFYTLRRRTLMMQLSEVWNLSSFEASTKNSNNEVAFMRKLTEFLPIYQPWAERVFFCCCDRNFCFIK